MQRILSSFFFFNLFAENDDACNLIMFQKNAWLRVFIEDQVHELYACMHVGFFFFSTCTFVLWMMGFGNVVLSQTQLDRMHAAKNGYSPTVF